MRVGCKCEEMEDSGSGGGGGGGRIKGEEDKRYGREEGANMSRWKIVEIGGGGEI